MQTHTSLRRSCRNGVRAQRGFSLIESMTVLAVTGTLLGTAVPSFVALQDSQRLKGAAALVETELQYARGLAVARGETVRFTFGVGNGSGCYVIHTGSPGSCSCSLPGQPAVCNGSGAAQRTVVLGPTDRLRIQTASNSFGFNPATGTVTPTATLKLSNAQSQTLHVVVNLMGRVRVCSPNGMPGYKAC